MFSMCSELTPRARILDTRIPQLMQPWWRHYLDLTYKHKGTAMEPNVILCCLCLGICHVFVFVSLCHSLKNIN